MITMDGHDEPLGFSKKRDVHKDKIVKLEHMRTHECPSSEATKSTSDQNTHILVDGPSSSNTPSC